jgi:hypothetical protein
MTGFTAPNGIRCTLGGRRGKTAFSERSCQSCSGSRAANRTSGWQFGRPLFNINALFEPPRSSEK